MWNGYGVCSNLASSGEPPPHPATPLLHVTTLTTAHSYKIRYDQPAEAEYFYRIDHATSLSYLLGQAS